MRERGGEGGGVGRDRDGSRVLEFYTLFSIMYYMEYYKDAQTESISLGLL